MKLLESLIKKSIPAKLFFIKNICVSCKHCSSCKYYNENHLEQHVRSCDVQQAVKEFFPETAALCPAKWDLSDFTPTAPIEPESLDFLKSVPIAKIGNIHYIHYIRYI